MHLRKETKSAIGNLLHQISRKGRLIQLWCLVSRFQFNLTWCVAIWYSMFPIAHFIRIESLYQLQLPLEAQSSWGCKWHRLVSWPANFMWSVYDSLAKTWHGLTFEGRIRIAYQRYFCSSKAYHVFTHIFTKDHIFTLKSNISKHVYSKRSNKMYACFDDFRKAYDPVYHEGFFLNFQI